jgi:hypothetical protein
MRVLAAIVHLQEAMPCGCRSAPEDPGQPRAAAGSTNLLGVRKIANGQLKLELLARRQRRGPGVQVLMVDAARRDRGLAGLFYELGGGACKRAMLSRFRRRARAAHI